MLRPARLLTVTMLSVLCAGACKAQEPEAGTGGMPETTADTAAPAMEPAAAPRPPAGPAKYRVEVTPLWTQDAFPLEYPAGKAHFSGLIGTAHDSDYRIVRDGQPPSPGLERLSETGKHDPLDAEIAAAVAAGDALALTTSGPLRDLTETATAEVAVDDNHQWVTLVAMIAPSPDWFAAVVDVNLLEEGVWVASKTVDAMAWDSGGDDGTTYAAADKDTNPKKPTAANTSPHFLKDGTPMPVARVTFTRM